MHRRWHNHLNPDIKRGEWGREEDEVIVRMHRRFGNQVGSCQIFIRDIAAISAFLGLHHGKR